MSGRVRRNRVLTHLVMVCALVCAGDGVRGQESTNFVMERVTVSSTAARVASASFAMEVTFGQEVPVGGASLCNEGYVQTLGFWSVLGGVDAPIRLRVDRDDINPAAVELSWTGSLDSFAVYRAGAPEAVVQPPNLILTTPACATDDTPPLAQIIYYLVVPDPGS